VNRKHLVLRVATARERQYGSDHSFALWAHTGTVINHNARRDGSILSLENGDFLRHVVSEELKCILFQTGDKFVRRRQSRSSTVGPG
jgi:hypothetical protein